MKNVIITIVLVSILTVPACTNKSAATKTLEAMGFTDIHVGKWAPLTCDKGDFSSTAFTAKNSRGKTVKGVVCCGLIFKNCTVRF